MRTTLLALALVMAACGKSERSNTPAVSDAPSASTMHGPDQLVLRLPRGGGQVRAFAYPELDSLIWKSTAAAPSIERVLGFDDEAGSVAAVDTRGALVRIDLRLDHVGRDTKPKLTHLASSDGSAVYGIDRDGNVVRLTPIGSWTFEPPAPARDVIPEPNGALLILADRSGGTTVWQVFPPDRSITDTATLPHVTRAMRTQVGDRVYFTVDSGLVGLRSRGLEPVPSIRLRHRVRALTTTPSGDRIYLATDSSAEVTVIDRYTHDVRARIPTHGAVSDLRMDPTGRYVLARPATGDSAWVIAVGTDRVVATVETEWRTDLPLVAPNGWLALLRGRNVVLVDGVTRRVERTVRNGGRDTWLFVAWNGFRPRPPGLDEPVTFGGDTLAPSDTADTSAVPESAVPPDTQFAPPASPAAPDSPFPTPAQQPARPAPPAGLPAPPGPDSSLTRSPGFTVQFTAVRSEESARQTAREIVVDGARQPRVVATVRGGVTIYRVILGPFPSRDEAERIARTSGKPYWIYEGAP